LNVLEEVFGDLNIRMIDNANVSQQVYTICGDKFKNKGFVPKDNLTEYVRWISSFYSNKKLREEFAANARNTIEEFFNFETHVNFFIKRMMK